MRRQRETGSRNRGTKAVAAGTGRGRAEKQGQERIYSDYINGQVAHACTHALAPRAIQPVYKVSSSSIVVFHGIPPWERRVNKHLSFLARSHGQVKMSQLGGPVSARVLLLLFPALPYTFFLLRGTTDDAPREMHGYKL